jgi:UTP--glucose-1-phosphate uridylyltransferase
VKNLIKKAIIPAAGLGTRLLPATKEQPKEMLPILVPNVGGKLFLKPFLQVVFEQLYVAGIREFCFIVGREKRSIEDHFTIDQSFMEYMKAKDRTEALNELAVFYDKVRNSTIAFANQPQPMGFADAVYRGRFFSGNESFVVHAGDDLVLSERDYLHRLVSVFEKYDADGVFLVQKVKDPKKYGVITGKRVSPRVYHVEKIEEKPSSPPSKLAVVAVYAFKPGIFDAIKEVKPGVDNELQLTDAIEALVHRNNAVYALELGQDERRIEIGDPASYREAFLAKTSLRARYDLPTRAVR